MRLAVGGVKPWFVATFAKSLPTQNGACAVDRLEATVGCSVGNYTCTSLGTYRFKGRCEDEAGDFVAVSIEMTFTAADVGRRTPTGT